MPMGRRRDVDDVDVLSFQHFSEIFVALHIGAGPGERGLEMTAIDIADGEEFAGGVDRFHMAHAHAAGADDGAGEDFAGRGEALSTEHMPGNDADGGEGGDGGLEEVTPGEELLFVHG